MNRELKFRYWNPIAKTYKMSWRYNLTHDGDILAYDVDMMDYDEPTDPKNSILVIQQYTGLKDKNGVEIYEGDIIHYKFNGDSYHKEAVDRILTCSYDEDEGMYSFDDSDHSYYWAEIKRHSNIIGNIYENPELLKA